MPCAAARVLLGERHRRCRSSPGAGAQPPRAVMLEGRCRAVDGTAAPFLQRRHWPVGVVRPEATALTGGPRPPSPHVRRRNDALQILRAAVDAVEPGGLVTAAISRTPSIGRLPTPIFVVSAGKAA